MTTEVGVPPPLTNVLANESTDKMDELRTSLHQSQGQLQSMAQEKEQLRRELTHLKGKLDQIVSAAQHDLDLTAQEFEVMMHDNSILQTKVKEYEKLNLQLEHDKLESKVSCAEQKGEMDAMRRDRNQLLLDLETREARGKFDQAELESSKKHVEMLQTELDELRAITNKFTQSSTTQSLDYRTTVEAYKKEKELAEKEVESVLERNKNQTNLLQRLEKKLQEVRCTSEAHISELKDLLKMEQTKVVKLNNILKKKKAGGWFASQPPPQLPQSPKRNASASETMLSPGTLAGNRSISPLRTNTLTDQKANYTSLRDLLKKEQNNSNHDQEDDQNKIIHKTSHRTSSELRVAEAKAERSQWKDQGMNDLLQDGGGVQGSMQSAFLEAAVQKSQKKAGFWDSMFGVNFDDEPIVLPPKMDYQISDGSLLTREIMQTVRESEKMQAEREGKKVKQNVKQLKTAVKWGFLNMLTVGEDDDESQDDGSNKKMGKKKQTSAGAVRVDDDDDDNDDEDIDMDTLRRLAATRTAGLTEEELNAQLAQRASDFSSVIADRLGSIREEDEDNRLSFMSDMTMPNSEEFRMNEQNVDEMYRAVAAQQAQQEGL